MIGDSQDGEVASTQDCLAQARAGDPRAAGLLVERLYPLVAKIVRAYVSGANSQEDCEQEVFLRLFARLDQFRGVVPLEHWVSRIAVHACVDALRGRHRRRELRWADLSEQEVELVRGAERSAGDHVEALAARELAGKMLDSLSAEDRVIVQMIDMEQRSMAEVAQWTGRSQTAVKVRAFRARRKLRKLFERMASDSQRGTKREEQETA